MAATLFDPEQLGALIQKGAENALPKAIEDATAEAVATLVQAQIQNNVMPQLVKSLVMSKALPGAALTEPDYFYKGAGKGRRQGQLDQQPKGLTYDPFTALDQMGFRERPTLLGYHTLREMSRKCPPITAIIITRVGQMASLSVPQPDPYSLGFQLALADKDMPMTPQLKDRQTELTKWIVRSGNPKVKAKRDKFTPLIKKLTFDALAIDQAVVEIVPDRKDVPSWWRMLDGATIRISDDLDEVNDDPDSIQYVQTYDEEVIAEFREREMLFGVRNPRSDIMYSGYGTSELEMLIIIVTALLNAIEYNSAFFTNGTVAKGILNFKGAIPDRELEAFRRQWHAMVSGIANCLGGDSTIWTPSGSFTLDGFLRGAESKETRIWTGERWQSGLVYKAGLKVPVRTTLGNGASLTTSPDHRFRVLNAEGLPDWRRQGELQYGDFVLVNKKAVEAKPNIPTYNGKAATPELMEVLGWLTGDGYLAHEGSGHGAINVARWFYRHDTEEWVRARHLAVIEDFDLAAEAKDRIVTEAEAEHLREAYGFKEIADRRLTIQLCSVRFTEWLMALGFKPSREGKVIPSFVFSMSVEHKAAFLRGLFSADGHNAKLRSPAVTIANDVLREQTKLLLLSLGIRTSLSEGRTKSGMKGRARFVVEAKSVLRIKDRDAFFSLVGFVQPHKQPAPLTKPNESNKYSRVAAATVLRFAREVRLANDAAGKTLLSLSERGDLNNILCGEDGCSLPRLLRYMAKVKIEIPAWLTDYYFEPVVGLEALNGGEPIQMYDVEIYDDVHAFTANGIVVHNSWRTPVVNSDEVQWINMNQSPRDLEFSQFMDWLLKVACAIYRIAPEEIGFQFGNTGQSSTMNEGGVAEKLEYSKDKGLVPLATDIAEWMTDKIVEPLDERFVFKFTGINARTREQAIELHTKESSSVRTVDEVRKERGDEPMPDGKGAIILNPVWLQNAQGIDAAKQGQQPGQGPQLDNTGVDEPPPHDQDQNGQEDTTQPQGPDLEQEGGQDEQQLAQSETGLARNQRRAMDYLRKATRITVEVEV